MAVCSFEMCVRDLREFKVSQKPQYISSPPWKSQISRAKTRKSGTFHHYWKKEKLIWVADVGESLPGHWWSLRAENGMMIECLVALCSHLAPGVLASQLTCGGHYVTLSCLDPPLSQHPFLYLDLFEFDSWVTLETIEDGLRVQLKWPRSLLRTV